MRKTKLTLAAVVAAMCFACSDMSNNIVSEESNQFSNATGMDEGRQCASTEVLRRQMQENPGLARAMEAQEEHTRKFINARGGETQAVAQLTDATTITIPVVVNVIYNSANLRENISDAQIASQIAVLNKDFSATNADVSKLTGTVFAGMASNMNIQFTLVKTVRKASNKTSWGTRDAMKSTRNGGIDATSPTTHLNMWVCNIGGGILGYAQFPGGKSSTDGVVIGPNYFGTSDAGTGFYLSAPYDKGRTVTHEVGHWINLRHIWGDATCGSDMVSDTPTHNASNGGCPAYPHLSTCSGTPIEMTMNYMDYTNDACMYMFSNGQKVRSRAIFAAGGARASFVP